MRSEERKARKLAAQQRAAARMADDQRPATVAEREAFRMVLGMYDSVASGSAKDLSAHLASGVGIVMTSERSAFHRASEALHGSSSYADALKVALTAACDALDEELNACGWEEVKDHPVLAGHAEVVEKGRELLREKAKPKRVLLGHCFLCEQPVWKNDGGELRSFDNRPQHYDCERIDAEKQATKRRSPDA